MAETNSWILLDREDSEFALPADLRAKDKLHGRDCGWVEQMRPLIREFSQPGETVLDPFCGFGSTLIAAALEDRQGIGIEVDPGRVLLSNERLQRLGFSTQQILEGNCLDRLPDIQPVDLILTNLPYFGCPSITDTADDQIDTTKITQIYGIETYSDFLARLDRIFAGLKQRLKPNGFIVATMQNARLNGITVPQAWDVAQLLAARYHLCDERVIVYGDARQRDALLHHETNRTHEYLLVAKNQPKKIDMVTTLQYLKALANEHPNFIVFGSMAHYLADQDNAHQPSDVDIAIPHHPVFLSTLVRWFESRGFAITRWGYPYREKAPLAEAICQESWYVRAERLTNTGSLCIFDLCFGEDSDYFDRLNANRNAIAGVPVIGAGKCTRAQNSQPID
jgi:hypothetical protein